MRAQDVSRSQGAGLKVARHLKASKWDQKKGEYFATVTYAHPVRMCHQHEEWRDLKPWASWWVRTGLLRVMEITVCPAQDRESPAGNSRARYSVTKAT